MYAGQYHCHGNTMKVPFFSSTRLKFSCTFSKMLNGVFYAKTFYTKVALKYHINLFFKFVIIKTQSIIRKYHLVLYKKLNLHLHLQEKRTPPKPKPRPWASRTHHGTLPNTTCPSIRRRLWPQWVATTMVRPALVEDRRRQVRLAEAEGLAREAREQRIRDVDPRHPIHGSAHTSSVAK